MSSTYRQYQEARDTAWRALLRLREKTLPVDVEALARDIGAELHPYPNARENVRLFTLTQQVRGVCVSLRIRGRWHLFLRDNQLNGARRRFAIAHELGHLLLGHETKSLAPGVRRFLSDENAGDLIEDPEDLQDYAADIFAIRLLAPACLLHELHMDTPAGIMNLCGLPPRAASLRAERMELLNERDAYYTNPLERQVRDAFRPFLLSARTDRAAAPPQQSAPDVPSSAPPLRSLPLVVPIEQPEEPPAPESKSPSRRHLMTVWQKRILAGALLLAALALLYLLGKGR